MGDYGAFVHHLTAFRSLDTEVDGAGDDGDDHDDTDVDDGDVDAYCDQKDEDLCITDAIQLVHYKESRVLCSLV